MKTRNYFKLFLIISISVLSFTGCIKTEDEPKVDYYKVMTDYMAANKMDLPDVIASGVTTAAAVSANPAAFYIIDLRSATDFAAGHIQGAVNSTVKDVLTAAQNAGGKPILLVCYTGQNAAYANVCLRLSGYADSNIMKWGMSAWTTQLDKWSANVSNQAVNHANWSTTNAIKTPVTFSLPTFTATAKVGADILKERVKVALDKGFVVSKVPDVLGTPANYFIVNYWTDADVNQFGHIKGAYRLNETLKLTDPVGFKNLNPTAVIVPYCWTGQTSAMVSAYLTVLGYDAKGLMFGANNMIQDALLAVKKNSWNNEKPKTDNPVVK